MESAKKGSTNVNAGPTSRCYGQGAELRSAPRSRTRERWAADEGVLSRPILIYLDQNYWGRFLTSHRHLGDFVLKLVEQGQAIFPLSSVHMLETLKAAPHIRHAALPFMEAVSNGHWLVNFISLLRLEFRRYVGLDGIDCLRHGLITDDPLNSIGPTDGVGWMVIKKVLGAALRFAERRTGQEASVFTILNAVADSKAICQGVAAILQRGAGDANQQQTAPKLDRESLARAIGVFPMVLPHDERSLKSAFPSIAVRMALQHSIMKAVPSGLAPNDLVDVSFLSATLPYFDLTTTDRKMGSRIREAGADSAIQSKVVCNIEEFRGAVEALL
jgi:hypothetical protein